MVWQTWAFVAPIIDLSGRLVKSFLHLVQSPFGVITFGESFPEVVLFFLKQLRITAHSGRALWERVWMTLNLAER